MLLGVPFEPRIDALFTLPLDAFVSARNELAKALARAGDKTMAAEVKALAKPSVASWTLNQVVRADRELASSFLGACDRLASAQLAPKSPGRGDERYLEAQSAQRTCLQVLLDRAAARLEASPQKRALIDRIARTLRAVARDTTVRDAFLEGRLTSDLEEPGFDVFAARLGIESSAGARLRLVPSPESNAPPTESALKVTPRAQPVMDASARRARLAALEAEAAQRRAAVLAAQSTSRAARAEVEAARSASAAAVFAQSEAAAARDRALEAVEAERRRLADAEARAEEAARAHELAATRAALEARRAAERERALAEAERAEQEARSAEREAEARVTSEAAFD